MRPSSILMMLLLPSPFLAGQTNRATTPAVFAAPPASESCPISFSADRKPNAGLVEIEKGVTFQSQAFQINFGSSSSPAILKVQGTMHGMTPGAYMSPISYGSRSAAHSTETFQLTASQGAPLHHSAVSTRKLGTVEWLELTRIEFADGTTWNSSAESRCVVAPSLLVLVNASPEPAPK